MNLRALRFVGWDTGPISGFLGLHVLVVTGIPQTAKLSLWVKCTQVPINEGVLQSGSNGLDWWIDG